MSHIRNLAGFNVAAADYQEYMERMRAAREAKKAWEAGKGARLRTFDSAIESFEEKEGQETPSEQDSSSSDNEPNRQYA